MATLERIYSETFDGEGVEGQRLLQQQGLSGVTPQTWPSARLIVVPSLRLVRLRFPVHEFVTAVRRGDNPPLPAPSTTRLVITRRDYIVRRIAVGESEFAALSVIAAGRTVAEALQAAQETWSGDVAELASTVRGWFLDWSAAGYFKGIECPRRSETPSGSDGVSGGERLDCSQVKRP